MSPVQFTYPPSNYGTVPSGYSNGVYPVASYPASDASLGYGAASPLWQTNDSYASYATVAKPKPSWFSSLWQAVVGYAIGHKLLKDNMSIQMPGGFLAHAGSIGGLTVALQTLKSNLTPEIGPDGQVESTPSWLKGILAFGATLAGLLFLCRRFDINALMNQSFSAKALRDLPIFSRLQQALSLSRPEAAPAAAGNAPM